MSKRRALSVLLALIVVGIGVLEPISSAAGEPVTLGTSGYTAGATAGEIGEGETSRVYVNNTLPNHVIDQITYSLSAEDAQKVNISADGEISLKPDYVPAADDSVEVIMDISYYSGDKVLFYDNMEDTAFYTNRLSES